MGGQVSVGMHVVEGRHEVLDREPVSALPGVASVTPAHRASCRPRRMLAAEIVASVLMMAVVAVALGASWATGLVVVAVAVLVRYRSGPQLLRPGLPRLAQVLRDTMVPFCVAGFAVAAGWWGRADLVIALAVSATGGAVALSGVLVRRRFPAPQRVVVVGSAVGVAEAATRWSDSRDIHLVGSLVVDTRHPQVPRPRTGGSLTETVGDVAEIDRDALLRSDPDLVLVVPTVGIEAEQVRRIGWALEGSGVALAVHNGMDGIAAHRLESTTYAGIPLTHVTSSRPTRMSLAVKAAFDRTAGAVLLTLLSPLLLVLIGLVRATSSGPGIFTQVRVGREGELFTMYKLRTMVTTAEADKATLMAQNEGAGVLFKMVDDPRITRVGGFLRKFSLDELPQLINVVKGDMSLVGPRPALPEEVAQYSSLERRRLAAKPGLTGLWQVSGRSDLSWDDSVRLDNHYTENWRFVDDGLILARTVKAVAFSNGAY